MTLPPRSDIAHQRHFCLYPTHFRSPLILPIHLETEKYAHASLFEHFLKEIVVGLSEPSPYDYSSAFSLLHQQMPPFSLLLFWPPLVWQNLPVSFGPDSPLTTFLLEPFPPLLGALSVPKIEGPPTIGFGFLT